MLHFLRPLFLKNSDRAQSVVNSTTAHAFFSEDNFLLRNHKREISKNTRMKEIILPDISKTAMMVDESFKGDLWYDILESFAVQTISNEQPMSIEA